MELPKSPYLKLAATYHHEQFSTQHFIEQYARVKKRYRVSVWELWKRGEPFYQRIPGSKKLELYVDEGPGYKRRDFVIAPNGEYVMSLGNYYKMTGYHKKFKEELNETS